MDGLLPVIPVQFGIILLTAIVHASLQLELGALLLLYHASLGKHIKRKTKDLVSSYIFGAAMLVILILSTIIFLIASVTMTSLSTESLAVLAAVLLTLAVLIWLFYYRTKQSTELWLPKSIALYINKRAKLTESNIEAFSLGMLTAFSEMPFSFVLMILAADSIVLLPFEFQFLSVLFYAFIAVLPLFILRFFVRRGSTVVDIQKWRVKNKNFFKALSGTLFLTLAIFIIAFKILGA
jgi:membrane protein implicated in regulation of membrane protease activity